MQPMVWARGFASKVSEYSFFFWFVYYKLDAVYKVKLGLKNDPNQGSKIMAACLFQLKH